MLKKIIYPGKSETSLEQGELGEPLPESVWEVLFNCLALCSARESLKN